MPGRTDDEIERTDDVALRVVHRVFRRFAHVHLRGVMIDDVKLLRSEQLVNLPCLPDIQFHKPCGGIEILTLARDQIVHNNNLMTVRVVAIANMRPNESGATGNKNFHAAHVYQADWCVTTTKSPVIVPP